MNVKKSVCGILCLIVLTQSCKRSDLMTYNLEDNVYFQWADGSIHYIEGTFRYMATDSIVSSFGWLEDGVSDLVAKIPVAVTGSAASYDRKYKVVVDPGSTAQSGIHFQALSDYYIMPAGKVLDTLSIRFLRAADLKSSEKWLNLRLVSTGDLKASILTGTYSDIGIRSDFDPGLFRLRIDDMFSMPAAWPIYYGSFSRKKLLLMMEVTELPLEHFLDSDNPTRFYSSFYANIFTQWLADQKAAGHTVYDEDGSEMRMLF